METAEIVKEVQNLPVSERAMLIDSLLRTLNPPESKIDKSLKILIVILGATSTPELKMLKCIEKK